MGGHILRSLRIPLTQFLQLATVLVPSTVIQSAIFFCFFFCNTVSIHTKIIIRYTQNIVLLCSSLVIFGGSVGWNDETVNYILVSGSQNQRYGRLIFISLFLPGLSGGAVAGIIIVLLLVAVLAAALVIFVIWWRKRSGEFVLIFCI